MRQHSKWERMTVHDIHQLPKVITVVNRHGEVSEVLRVMRRDFKRNVVWVVKEVEYATAL